MTEDKFDVKLEVQKAIEKFRKEFADRSFSQRHPELGRMINCAVCFLRHRSSQVCHQRFVKELTPPEGLTGLTKFQLLGRAAFAKKRIKPHYSKKRLQLVQRTVELYPVHSGIWPSTPEKSVEVVTMQMARREAREGLEKEYAVKRARLQDAQYRNRRINHGLVPGNSSKNR